MPRARHDAVEARGDLALAGRGSTFVQPCRGREGGHLFVRIEPFDADPLTPEHFHQDGLDGAVELRSAFPRQCPRLDRDRLEEPVAGGSPRDVVRDAAQRIGPR